MRKAEIRFNEMVAGYLFEKTNGYEFTYAKEYLASEKPVAISKTLPIAPNPFVSQVLFPFFDGLIPEGWLLEITEQNWKIDRRDRMGLLLACCRNCIGAVSVYDISEIEE